MKPYATEHGRNSGTQDHVSKQKHGSVTSTVIMELSTLARQTGLSLLLSLAIFTDLSLKPP